MIVTEGPTKRSVELLMVPGVVGAPRLSERISEDARAELGSAADEETLEGRRRRSLLCPAAASEHYGNGDELSELHGYAW